MIQFDYVFVVLVYRNTQDLKEFFQNFGIPNSKVIVVNSFYDDESENEFKEISERYSADFLSVPNRGYGAGNNAGISYALDKYKFDYLIISNADIEIKKFDVRPSIDVITAPEILTLAGKKQNPHTPYYSRQLESMKNFSFTNNKRNILLVALAINKTLRQCFYLVNKVFKGKRIHAPHGAFIILPYKILVKLVPIFNEKMFLFAEEDHIAMKCKKYGISVEYNPEILVLHKEDGSVGSSNVNQLKITKDSFITYYNYWYNDIR